MQNTSSRRFNLPEREADGDWLDEQHLIDGAPPRVRTTVTVLTPKTIISYNKVPDIPFDRSINPVVGCEQRHTVVRYFENGSSFFNAHEFLDQNRTSAIAKVSLCSLLGTYATIEPDTKFAPHRFSLFPVGRSPSLGVELLAASPETFDRGSILDGDQPTIFGAAAVESTILKIREPIANQQLPRTVSYVLVNSASSILRSGDCNDECEDGRHAYSLSEPSTGAMVFSW